MNFIALIQIVLKDQEIRQRYREVIKFHIVKQMLFGIVNQFVEAAFGLLLVAELVPRHPLIKYQLRRLVIIIHRAGRLFQADRCLIPALDCLLMTAQALIGIAKIIINVILLRPG
ncbi:hypothetical protein D3C77_674610 [compost metagenome]